MHPEWLFLIRTTRFAAAVICCAMLASAGTAAQDQPPATDCLNPAQIAAASEAYDAYCIRCHKLETLVSKWFSARGTGEDAVKALAVFLDNHGSCPHNHHELLARWLAENADSN